MASRRRDPRHTPRPETVNERIQNRHLAHVFQFQRMSLTEARRVGAEIETGVLLALRDRLTGRLERIRSRGFDTGPWSTQQLRNLLATVSEIVAAGSAVARGRVRALLRQIGAAERDWQLGVLDDAIPFDFKLNQPSVSDLRKLWTITPIDGKLLGSHFRDVSSAMRANVDSAIQRGLLRGDGARTIMAAVGQVMPTSRLHVEAVTRTAITHVSTGARELVYVENADVVDRVQWVSTLDTRTSTICFDLDGQTYPINEGPRPPAHPNCRSTTIPIIREADGSDGLDGLTRASMDGQVPATVSAKEWLSGQSAERQNEALGPGVAKLFREGKIDRFTDRHFRPLTLSQLRDRAGVTS